MNVDAGTLAAIIGMLNAIVTIGGGFFFVGRVTARLDARDAEMKRIEDSLHEVRKLLVTSAVEVDRLKRAEADIENIESDIRGLRRGVGYINDGDARGVNREY